jgi:hypothetical protein
MNGSISIPQPAVPKAPKAIDLRVEKSDRQTTLRLADLQHRLQASALETAALEDERRSLQSQLTQQDSDLKQEERHRLDLEQQLSLANANAQTLRAKLDQATTELALTPPSPETLQKRVGDLNGELEEKNQQIARQEEFLQRDRDIRNLMGARDLYIGEIYDIAKSGKTQKPFGRVFYTQGKSLVFYAYDLDQQPGVKLASTFQAWGRRGVDQQHDISLGIFYQDDQNQKRWILKSNDGVTLSQLDAVFVTVEPHGASTKPTGKPLLFTYLKLPPNHP